MAFEGIEVIWAKRRNPQNQRNPCHPPKWRKKLYGSAQAKRMINKIKRTFTEPFH